MLLMLGWVANIVSCNLQTRNEQDNDQLLNFFSQMGEAIQHKLEEAKNIRATLNGAYSGAIPRNRAITEADHLSKVFSSVSIYLDSI